MTALQFVLLLIAAVLFGLAAAGVGGRINLVAAGLCLMAVAFLLPLGAALF
jgi:hypothetical protein